MKLSEGFPSSENQELMEKLEKYKDVISPKKGNKPALRELFQQLKSEIVKLLKKKRSKVPRSNKGEEERSSTSSSSNKSSILTITKDKVKISNFNLRTPPNEKKEIETNKNEEEKGLLGKRKQFKDELERELELFLPSKFFVITNEFYKEKFFGGKTGFFITQGEKDY